MSQKPNKKKTRKISQWRWQLDLLLLLLTVSILMWTVVNMQLIDMSRVIQAYLPVIEEPKGLAVRPKSDWLETEQAAIQPVIQSSEPVEEQAEISEEQESTIVASADEPESERETWDDVTPKSDKKKPQPNYVTSTEKIDKKADLTPKDELF